MQENVKLTREQIIFLTFIGTIGNLVYIHTWIDDYADRAAWIACLAGILLTIPFLLWIFNIAKSHPKSTIFDVLESGLGKFTNIFISIIYISINIAIAVTHLNMFTEMLKVFFLHNTPLWIIMALLMFMGVIFVNGKINSFARLVEILAIVGALNYFFAFIFVFPQNFKVEYFIPIFDTSVLGIIQGVIFITGGASECVLLFFIYVSFIPDPAKHYMWAVKGIVLGSVVFAFAIFMIIAMMSPELAKRIAFGGVNAARLIHLGEFVQGLEIFIFGTYQFIAIGKITICTFCAWTASKKIFNNKKPLLNLLIISLLIFVISVYINSYNTSYFIAVFLANYIILPFSIIVLLLASFTRIKKNKKAGNTLK